MQCDWCHFKKRKLGHGQTQRRGHVKANREGGLLPAKERDLRRNLLCRDLHLGHLAAGLGENTFLFLGHSVCGTLLHSPSNLIYAPILHFPHFLD